MSTIDTKIVQMKMDNEDFESKAKTSMDTLDKLKARLAFDNTSAGVDVLNDSIGETTEQAAGLSSGVQEVQSRFDALRIMGTAALTQLANSIVSTGTQLVKSFTVTPILSGLQEYELKLNSVQTILANTQSRTKEISQEAVTELNTTAAEATTALKAANEEELEDFKKTQKAELKAYKEALSDELDELKSAQAQETKELNAALEAKTEALNKELEEESKLLDQQIAKETAALNAELEAESKALDKALSEESDALDKQLEQESKALDKALSEESKALDKSLNEQSKALDKACDEETEALNKTLKAEKKALEEAIKDEQAALKEQHQEKLALYNEEYLEKLKVIDEERYNKLKQVQDEIDAINALTEAEETQIKADKQQAKLSALQAAVDNAETYEERVAAEEALAEYKQELAREQLLAERELQINELKQKYQDINDEYDAKEDAAYDEYNTQVSLAQEEYETELAYLKEEQAARKEALEEEQAERKKALKEEQQEKKEALKEEIQNQKDALKETQQAQKDALKETQAEKKAALKEEQQEQKDALKEQQQAKKDALKEEQQERKDALKEEQAAKKAALKEENEAAKEYLKESQEAVLKSVKREQDAKIDALEETQDEELKALKERHKQALANIEEEKNAKIKALVDEAQAEKTKGSSLYDVNSALDELNTYADKTIYNFAEMTRNIGTFTAAGVDLDTSVKAIKGIANLAAVSGSSSQQASTAMYQLSQAIATGTVKLQDWNSVVNAGMGGQVFQDSLKETARVHGVAIDEIIAKEGSFRDSLSKGWLTSDILTETLSKFTGDLTEAELATMGYSEEQAKAIMEMGQTALDAATKVKTFSQLQDTLAEAAQSGWTESWEIIMGDFENAKKLWTTMSDYFGDMIQKSADARNAFLEATLTNNWEKLSKKVNETGISVGDFQNKIVEIGKAHGVVTDEMIENAGGFEESLKSGWLSADILREAFANLSDEELKSLGYTDSQISKFRELANSAQDADSPVSQLFKDLDKPSGRELIWDSVLNTFKALFKIVDAVKEAFAREMPSNLTDSVAHAIDVIHSFTEKIIISDETAEKITNTFQGFAAIIRFVKDLFVAIVTPIGSVFGAFSDMDVGILDITSHIGLFIAKIVEAVEHSGIFKEISSTLSSVLGTVAGAIAKIIEKIIDYIAGIAEAAETSGVFEKMADGLKTAFEVISDVMKTVFDTLHTGFDIAKEKVGQFISTLLGTKPDIGDYNLSLSSIGDALKELGDKHIGFKDTAKTVFDQVKEHLKPDEILNGLSSAFEFFRSGLASAVEWLGEKFGDVKDVINGFLDKIREAWNKVVEAFSSKEAKEIIDLLTRRAVEGGIVLFLYKVFSGIVGLIKPIVEGFGKISKSIAGLFDALSGTLKSFSMKVKAEAFKEIAEALVMLAASLWVISTIDSDKLMPTLGALGALMASLTGVILVLDKFMGSESKGGSEDKSILGSLKNLVFGGDDEESKLAKFGSLIAAFGVAVVAMAAAMKILSTMTNEQIAIGTLAVSGVLGIIALVTAELDKIKGDPFKMASIIVAYGVAFKQVAKAVKVFAKAIEDIGSLDFGTIIKGLGSITVVLGEIYLMLKKLGEGDKMKISSMTLLALAGLLWEVSSALKKIGNMGWDEIAKGLIGMGGALAELSLAMNAFKGAGTKEASIAMDIAAASLLVIGKALKEVGGMSLGEICTALLAIGGALTELGIAAYALAPLQGTLYAVAAALIAMGTACLEIGAGIDLAGHGIKAIAEAIDILGKALAVNGPLIIQGIADILTTVMGLIPDLMKILADGIVAFIDGLAKSADALGDAFITLFKMALRIVRECIPDIVETLLEILDETLKSLADHIPSIVGSIISLIAGIINAVAEHIGELVDSVVNLFKNLFAAANEALKKLDFEQLVIGVGSVTMITKMLTMLGGMISQIPLATKGVAMFTVVVAELSAALAAVGALYEIPHFEDLVNNGQRVLKDIGNAIGGFFGGIIGGLLEGVASSLPKIGEYIAEFTDKIGPFIEMASNLDTSAVDGVKNLADAIKHLVDAANSGSLLTKIFGQDKTLDVFGTELASFGKSLKKYNDSIDGVDFNMVNSSADSTVALANAFNKVPRTGGFLELFTGNKFMDFINNLSVMGEGLKKYYSVIRNIEFDILVSSAFSIKSLANALSKVPTEGGFLTKLFTGDKFEDFAGGLVAIGNALSDYARAIDEVDTDKLKMSASALKTLITVLSEVPHQGGWLEWIFGGKDISKFAKNLEDIGYSLASFNDSITNVSGTKCMMASMALKDLINTLSDVPESGGALNWIFGGKDISNFADDLKHMGNSLLYFYMSIVPVDTMKVSSAAMSLQMLITALKDAPENGGWLNKVLGSDDISNFAGNLTRVGHGLAAFYDACKDVDSNKMMMATMALTMLVTSMSMVPETSGAFEAYGAGMSQLGPGLRDFNACAMGINVPSCTMAAMALQTIIKTMSDVPTSGGLIDMWNGGQNFGAFSEGMVALGNGLLQFYLTTKLVNGPTVIMASMALKALMSAMAEVPIEGGLKDLWTGTVQYDKFAKGLSKIGMALMQFYYSVQRITLPPIEAAAYALNSLLRVFSGLPIEGGLKDLWTGTVQYDKFAKGLQKIGFGLCNFYLATYTLDYEKVAAASSALDELLRVFSGIPIEGGLTDLWSGTHDYEKFAKGLKDIGLGLFDFYLSTKDILEEKVTTAARSLNIVMDQMSQVPMSGGLSELWTGSPNYSKFANGMQEIADGLYNFYVKTDDVQLDKIQNASSALKILLDVMAGVPLSCGLKELWDGNQNYTKVGSGMAKLGEGLGQYHNFVKSVDSDKVRETAYALKVLMEAFSLAPVTGGLISLWEGDEDYDYVASGIKSMGGALGSYYNFIKSIADFEKMNFTVDFLGRMLSVLSDVDTSGGIVGWWSGKKDYDGLSKGIISMGTGIRGFFEAVSGLAASGGDSSKAVAINADVMNIAMNNIQRILNMFENLPDIYMEDTGINRVKDFADSIIYIANKISVFISIISGVGYDNIKNACLEVRRIIDCMKQITSEEIEQMGHFKEALLDLATDSISAFCEEFRDAEDDLRYAVIEFLDVFNDEIRIYGDIIKDSAQDLIDGFNETIVTEENKQAYRDSGQTVVDEFAGSIEDNQQTVVDAANTIADAGTQALEDRRQDFYDQGTNAAREFADGLEGNQSTVENKAELIGSNGASAMGNSKFEYRDQGEESTDQFAYGINNNRGYVYDKAESVANEGLKGIKHNSADFETAGANASYGFGNGIESGWTYVRNCAFNIANIASETIRNALDENSPSKLWAEYGSYASEGFAEGMTAKLVLVKNSAEVVAKSASTVVEPDEVYEEYVESGSSASRGFADGIESNTSTVTQAANTMKNSASIVVEPDEVYDDYYEVGTNVSKGVADGSLQESYLVIEAVNSILTKVLAKMKYSLGINSPSKVFAEFGAYCSEGLALGITDNSVMVEDATSEIADNAMAALSGSMDKLAAFVDEDFDVSPTITPVLDTAGLEAQAMSIDSMFAERSIQIANEAYEDMYRQNQLLQNGLKVDNSNIVQAINSMNSRIDEMNANLLQMQVVLDTGAVVGGISDEMDKAFGRMSVRNGRRL